MQSVKSLLNKQRIYLFDKVIQTNIFFLQKIVFEFNHKCTHPGEGKYRVQLNPLGKYNSNIMLQKGLPIFRFIFLQAFLIIPYKSVEPWSRG